MPHHCTLKKGTSVRRDGYFHLFICSSTNGRRIYLLCFTGPRVLIKLGLMTGCHCNSLEFVRNFANLLLVFMCRWSETLQSTI